MSERETPEREAPVQVSGFDLFYGLEMLELTPERGRAQLAVTDRHKQPWGVVHGGVYASIAESVASYATALVVIGDGKVATGMSNHTSFLRPIGDGTIHASAQRRHRGRTTWVWEVEMTDDEGHLCALSRVTIAVRDGSPQGQSPST